MTKLFEAQSAVFSRLEQNVELMKKVTGIHDSVPDKEKFPYIVLGRIYSTPVRTKTTEGEQIVITIDIWSGSKGKKETINIINLIEVALTDDLDVEGAFLLSQKVNSREVLEEVNDLYHGTVEFEILLDLE